MRVWEEKERFEVAVNEIATNKKLKCDNAVEAEKVTLKPKAILDTVYNKSSKANSNNSNCCPWCKQLQMIQIL